MFWLILLLFGACSKEKTTHAWMTPNGKIKVLSTLSMIDDLVKQIGGEYVDSIPLIKGELDPHSYQLVKGDDEKLAFADLIFYNGLGLEHGPSLHAALEKSNKAISLGDKIRSTQPELILYYQGQIDPHIWMDISMWARTVPYIVKALASKDPQHADVFRVNGEKLLQNMSQLHRNIRNEMMQIPQQQRYLVTSHDAFNYFTRAYLAEENELNDGSWQKRFAAPEGLAPESQLSVAEIQFIIDYLAKHHIHMLFPESNVSKDSIRKIVAAGKDKGLNLKMATDFLYADAMGKPGSDGDSYLKMIKHNADTIARYLHNNYP
jgi:manganese/zinc/iron transport system substrate-binding protein